MAQIEKSQIRDIHVLGAGLGIVERGSHDDGLHLLIAGITGKVSTTELTKAEAEQVLSELTNRMRLTKHPVTAQKAKKHHETAGGMTEGQQRKVWHLMYELRDLDKEPGKATPGERLCGIIKKELDIDVSPKNPFEWLGFDDGDKLIEMLKRYVRSAAKKQAKGGGNG